MTEFQCTEYHLDDHDCLSFIDAQWDVFALQNDSPHLINSCVLAKPLFSFISNRETDHLYRLLVAKVRQEQCKIHFSYRCDSPTHKRFMSMTMYPLGDNQVGFLSRLDWQIPSQKLQILDVRCPRSLQLITMCSWCKKIKLADHAWCEIDVAVDVLKLFEKAILPRISHGVCPECYTAVMEEYELERYACG